MQIEMGTIAALVIDGFLENLVELGHKQCCHGSAQKWWSKLPDEEKEEVGKKLVDILKEESKDAN